MFMGVEMDIQKEREAFEEYTISKHKNRSPLILTQRIQHGFSENYIVQGVQDCWEAWQAAKANAVLDGFVSIEDELPENGQYVIAFDAINHCVFKNGEFLQEYLESDTGYKFEEPVEVTHWRLIEAQEPSHD